VVYDNGMKLEQLYNGRNFPEFYLGSQQLIMRDDPSEQYRQEITVPEPQRAAPSLDAIRLQNELTQALNRGGEGSDYIKSLVLAAAAQRYSQIPDPTPAHALERLRARLEEGPADSGTLSALLETAVRAVRVGPGKTVELELPSGGIITEEKEESA